MRTKSKIIRETPPADFEEVKRRFIRQNRELAKNNSNQSLRIRSLELDVSRLLAENLELRNQVLHLQNEVYTAQTRASTAAVQRVKLELQAKIAELSGMVDGIEDLEETPYRAEGPRKPLEGNWRERQPLAELMRDSQMPTITEDKLFPRRTLDAREIQAIRLSDQSSTESPDLGPPPIARFDDADPVKNGSPLFKKIMADVTGTKEDDELPATLSVNLETRRKRKDGQPRLEIRRHSILPQSPAKNEGETSSILRTGAKRKLADREMEKPINPPSKGDFTFSHKIPTEEPQSNSTSTPSDVKSLSSKANETSSKPARKVLGDKSVNMSPRKPSVREEKSDKDKADHPIPSRLSDSKEPNPTRRRRTSAIPIPAPQDEVVETVELAPLPPAAPEPPPQTPAEPDFFSPTPSEPSTLHEPGRGDTPPPGDLSNVSTTTDGAVRPSRRARSAVNYAEPSLISKMRRPDKKMVDAVTGLQDPRRAMSASGGDRKSSSSHATFIKQEPTEDEEWKVQLPAANGVGVSSPLTQKCGAEELRASPLSRPPLVASEKPSASSATISALMAAGRKRRESGQSQLPLGTDIDVAARKMEELELYEFKESSSPLMDDGANLKAKLHRRHSSIPKDVGSMGASAVQPDEQRAVSVGRLERAASRRKSMQL